MHEYPSLLLAGLLILIPTSGSGLVLSGSTDGDAVRAAYKSYEQTLDRGDAAAVAAFWTEDGVYMGMGTPTTRGRSEIERVAKQLLTTTTFSSRTTQIHEVTTAGDLAYLIGTTSVSVKQAGQDPLRVSARLLFVWKRGTDGTWRIAGVMSNGEPSSR